MNRNVRISEYSAENRHNQLHSANPWVVPEICHSSKTWQEWLLPAPACFRGAWVGQCKDQDLVKVVFLKVLEQKKMKGMYFMWNGP